MKALLTVATTFLSIVFLILLMMTFSMKQARGGREGDGLTSLFAIATGIAGILTAVFWHYLRKLNQEE